MKMKALVTVIIVVLAVIGGACSSSDNASNTQIALEQQKSVQPVSPCKDVDGNYLKGFIEAHKSFLDDAVIPIKLRKIENYIVSFREEKGKLYVDFAAKMTPEEKKQDRVGGGTDLGVSCTYTLDKTTYQVISKIYPK